MESIINNGGGGWDLDEYIDEAKDLTFHGIYVASFIDDSEK